MNTFSFIRQRVRHYWQVFATLALGVLLATALLAAGPVLVDAVIEFGFRRALATADPLAANLRLFASDRPDAALFQALDAEADSFVQDHFAAQRDRLIATGGTRYTHPWVSSGPLPDQRVNLRFYGADADLLDRVTFLSGSWPAAQPPVGNVAPAVIGEPMARAYGLSVGDRLPLSLRPTAAEPEFWLDIAGIIRPADSQDPFWFGNRSPLRAHSDARYVAQFSALIPAAAFFPLADAWFSPSEVSLEWLLLLSPAALSFDDSPALQARLALLDAAGWQVGDAGIRIDTHLPETLAAFDSQAQAVRAPLLLLTATAVLLALYYVLTAAALSLGQVEREFATLRGRGASGWQLFRLQLLEGTLVSLVALVSGPGLAWLFVAALSLWGPLADVRQAEWALRLPAAAWSAAALGALACLASLLVPVPAILRRSIIAHQQFLSRADDKPWWQRYYIDLFILLLGLILLWRLHTAGSIVGGTTDRPGVDWLLLLAPLALLLGAAAILLRVFPLFLNLAARLAARRPGLPAALAMWQAARNPIHIARLVLFLTLAMALGLFSSGLNAALDLNEAHRARYAAGGDLRLADASLNTAAALPSLTGVQATALAWRAEGSLTTRIGTVNPRFDLLAIDPGPFAATAEFRSDFADRPLPELLDLLTAPPAASPPPLPGTPARLGLWLYLPPDLLDGYTFRAKLQTAQSDFLAVSLQPSAANENLPPEPGSDASSTNVLDFAPEPAWFLFDAPLPDLAPAHLPLRLHSLWLQWRSERFWAGWPVGVDDVTVTGQDGRSAVADSFESGLTWISLSDTITTSLEVATPHTGSSYLMLNVARFGLQPNRWHGVAAAPADPDALLPALVSREFATIARLQVGDPVSTWVDSVPVSFQVVGLVDHFPTLVAEKDAGFLVTLRQPILAHVNAAREVATAGNEVFIAAAPAVTEAAITDALPELFARETRIWEADAIRKAIKSDPLSLGLRSVTLFAYLLTVLLSLVAFGVHFTMTARRRGVIYGVLRALGLSPRQLYAALLFEQVVLVFSGLTLGTLLGLLLNWLTLPGLPITLAGRPPVPPFLVQTDWPAVVRIYLVLTVAFLALLAVAVSRLWRSRLHRVLNIGEE